MEKQLEKAIVEILITNISAKTDEDGYVIGIKGVRESARKIVELVKPEPNSSLLKLPLGV